MSQNPTRLSHRVRAVRPSPTLAMADLTRALRDQGRDVIILSMGEPDFDTEDFIKDAGIAAIRNNDTKYTEVPGTRALRRALSEKFRRDNGLHYPPDQIIVSSGLKPILHNAIFAALDPGDEIIIPAPYWVSYPDIAKLAGAAPVFVPCHEHNGFRLAAEDLEAAITPRTRMLVLNTPNNPTGATYAALHLCALGAVLERYPNIWVLTDEIYEHLVYDGLKSASMAAICPTLLDRTITCNGMSKGYVMTGWRLGFAGGPPDIIREMDKLQSQTLGSPSSIAQAAAIAALAGEDPGRNTETYMQRNARSFQERRDFAAAWLDRIPGLHCHKPEGAFYLYPGCEGVLGKTTLTGQTLHTDEDFVLAMLEAEAIGAVPGTAFGHSPYFRISYAMAQPTLAEALTRIERFCRSLR